MLKSINPTNRNMLAGLGFFVFGAVLLATCYLLSALEIGSFDLAFRTYLAGISSAMIGAFVMAANLEDWMIGRISKDD